VGNHKQERRPGHWNQRQPLPNCKQSETDCLKILRVSKNPQCRVVIDRLAMAISIIALKSANTCWSNSIADIITFGSANAD
jgi:hypothetical protein